jgi:hypothetical protein
LTHVIAADSLDSILDSDAPVLLVLDKVDAEARRVLQRRHPILLLESDSGAFANLVNGLRPHVEALIERLVRAHELHMGDDLQEVVDLGLYNPRLGVLFETLWLARFEHTENRDFAPHVRELLRLTFADPSPLIRNDALLFWLTLLHQNDGTSSHREILLVLTSPAGFDTAMRQFIQAAEHWADLGSPVRFVTDLETPLS